MTNEHLISFWSKGFLKVHVVEASVRSAISRIKYKENGELKEVKEVSEYFYPKGKRAWDFIVPSKFYNRIARLLGLKPREKNQNRVKAGVKVQTLKSRYVFPKVMKVRNDQGGA